MKILSHKKLAAAGFTLAEAVVAIGIGSAILTAFIMSSVALQRSFVAIADYTKGMNDQMRISDYLSLDMRRAFSISVAGSSASPPVTVTLIIPNFYTLAPNATPSQGNPGDTPNSPYIQTVNGWPFKKHHHNHHQDIILNEIVNYGNSWNGSSMTDPTLTVTYTFDNNAYTLTRQVTNSANQVISQTIATDVKDFSVNVSDTDETANTQITFQPRFRTMASSSAITSTTYYQTTLTRNTR
ncbi:MAG TPA: hypothetical protein VLK27_01725 [Chthoniobacterales bacterium]|nr:hypothetical protein [Chthoniobacterales bacterium]